MSPHEPFVRSVRIRPGEGYPFTIPALAALEELPLDPRVTFLAGENGSGKSTLAEAIALAAGFGPEGGSQNYGVSTRDSHAPLHEAVTLVRGARRPRTGFFLRAESFYNVATTVGSFAGPERAAYGERSLHEQSHGESFLALVVNRFGPNGFYVLGRARSSSSRPTRRSCSASPARRSTASTTTGSRPSGTTRPTPCSSHASSSRRRSGSCATCSPTSLPACSGFARPR